MPNPVRSPRPFRVRSALLMLCVALFAAACESGSQVGEAGPDAEPPSAAAAVTAPRDACTVLPAAEVGAVLGGPVRDSLALDMPAESGGGLSQCNYAMGDDPAVAALLLRVSAEGTTASGAAGVRSTFQESGIAIEEVPGLGDEAFWGSNQLHVFAGQRWYLVVSPPPSGGLAQARALAERALARLAAQ